jgi:hypothetical protein
MQANDDPRVNFSNIALTRYLTAQMGVTFQHRFPRTLKSSILTVAMVNIVSRSNILFLNGWRATLPIQMLSSWQMLTRLYAGNECGDIHLNRH